MTNAKEPRGALGGAIKGAIAGAAAVWLMDRVTWALYKGPDPAAESEEAHQNEKEAQVEGKYAAQAAVAQASRAVGIEMSEDGNYRSGQIVHYAMGIAPGILYGIFRDRIPVLRSGRGLLYGAGLFALVDEVVVPALGAASPPMAYPKEAHVRGLIGHLVLGAATDTVLDVLEEVV